MKGILFLDALRNKTKANLIMGTVYGESTCGNGGLRVEMTKAQPKTPRLASTIAQETDVVAKKGLSRGRKWVIEKKELIKHQLSIFYKKAT
jgi:hypothetical protein